MGITAENIAEKYNITKDEQDQFATNSQNKAELAQQNNKFLDEIVPVKILKKKEEFIFKEDEFPRHGTTFDKLNNLKPVFKKNGTVTAGNASGLNDGSAAVCLMNYKKAIEIGVKPLARIVSWATI